MTPKGALGHNKDLLDMGVSGYRTRPTGLWVIRVESLVSQLGSSVGGYRAYSSSLGQNIVVNTHRQVPVS